jgi:hypothetical protein
MKTWRFVTIMLTALSMGAAWAHLLEMPAKLQYEGSMWLHLLQTLYPPGFGTVGGFSEIGAVIAAIILLFVVRGRGRAFAWTVLGAICLVATHAVFWIWVSPVNAAMLPLSSEMLPADWTRLRDQWEYAHASRAILQVIALGAFVVSILVEVPPATPIHAKREVHDIRS